jgi:hypothetical protein
VRRAQFEHQLVLLAEIDLLHVLALVQVPEMQPAAVFRAEQHLGHQTVLEGVGRAPLAGDHGVVAEMPPEIIGEFLGPAVQLPLAEHVEAVVIEQEDAAGPVALGIGEGVDIDSLRPAVSRVQP